MKKMFTILVVVLPLLVSRSLAQDAQDTIVAWTFPNGSNDSLVDVSIDLNSSRYISCQYGIFNTPTYHDIAINYTTNGSLGSPDKSAQATGWNGGADSAYWMVKFKTTGYENLVLFSKQQAGGSNPGPRDFKAQYKLSGSDLWNDLEGGILTCQNNWTSASLNGISLPEACENFSSNVSIRWIMTSNFDINGGTVLETGISKIDDIIVTGTVISGISSNINSTPVRIFPNPNNGSFNIENDGQIKSIAVYNLLGKAVYENNSNIGSKIQLAGFNNGIYFVKIISNDNQSITYKVSVK